MEDYEEKYNKEKYISDEERYNNPQKGPYKCPNCGSWNTFQSSKVDKCNSCGDETVYP